MLRFRRLIPVPSTCQSSSRVDRFHDRCSRNSRSRPGYRYASKHVLTRHSTLNPSQTTLDRGKVPLVREGWMIRRAWRVKKAFSGLSADFYLADETLGNQTNQIYGQHTIDQIGAAHLHPIGQDERALELSGRYSPIDVFTVIVVRLTAAYDKFSIFNDY